MNTRFTSPRRPALFGFAFLLGLLSLNAAPLKLRVGYFPNITHAQALIGAQGTREGKGWFEERLGPEVLLEWYAFNAGPSATEAIFANSIDISYIGPNPVLNAYIRSKGKEMRVLAGSAYGGAALVLGPKTVIASTRDFRGLTLASPQLGNTQDIAARAWLKKQGFSVTLSGGEVRVLPTPNPDQLLLLQQGKVAGVWTVEPWVSRLLLEAEGRIFLEQDDAITTVLVSSTKALRTQPKVVEAFRKAHGELTAWLVNHPQEAQEAVRRALSKELRRAPPETLVASAWARLSFSEKLDPRAFDALVRDAQSVGFLRDSIPLGDLFLHQP